jgi:hypothetical protein
MGKNYNSAPVGDANLLLDGQTLEQMAQYDLTIQGGWDGLGQGTLDLTRPSTLDGVSLLILNWMGNVRLKNLRIRDASSGLTRAAICIRTAGSIQLEHVRANHSLYGTSLDNTASLSSPPAAVTVTHSDFSANDYAGLSIYTNGAVTLDHVIASHNVLGYGAKILNSNYEVASSVTVTDGQFHENSATGLVIQSNGPITLNNLHAHENGRTGISVDNRHGVEDVLVDGINMFLGNGRHGLEVHSNGAITARSLTAIANRASGFRLLTTASTLTDSPAVGLRELHADRNSRAGLEIYADGQVSLAYSSAYQNARYGLYVRGATDKSSAAPALTLEGFLSDSNGINEDILTTAPVARTVFP